MSIYEYNEERPLQQEHDETYQEHLMEEYGIE